MLDKIKQLIAEIESFVAAGRGGTIPYQAFK